MQKVLTFTRIRDILLHQNKKTRLASLRFSKDFASATMRTSRRLLQSQLSLAGGGFQQQLVITYACSYVTGQISSVSSSVAQTLSSDCQQCGSEIGPQLSEYVESFTRPPCNTALQQYRTTIDQTIGGDAASADWDTPCASSCNDKIDAFASVLASYPACRTLITLIVELAAIIPAPTPSASPSASPSPSPSGCPSPAAAPQSVSPAAASQIASIILSGPTKYLCVGSNTPPKHECIQTLAVGVPAIASWAYTQSQAPNMQNTLSAAGLTIQAPPSSSASLLSWAQYVQGNDKSVAFVIEHSGDQGCNFITETLGCCLDIALGFLKIQYGSTTSTWASIVSVADYCQYDLTYVSTSNPVSACTSAPNPGVIAGAASDSSGNPAAANGSSSESYISHAWVGWLLLSLGCVVVSIAIWGAVTYFRIAMSKEDDDIEVDVYMTWMDRMVARYWAGYAHGVDDWQRKAVKSWRPSQVCEQINPWGEYPRIFTRFPPWPITGSDCKGAEWGRMRGGDQTHRHRLMVWFQACFCADTLHEAVYSPGVIAHAYLMMILCVLLLFVQKKLPQKSEFNWSSVYASKALYYMALLFIFMGLSVFFMLLRIGNNAHDPHYTSYMLPVFVGAFLLILIYGVDNGDVWNTETTCTVYCGDYISYMIAITFFIESGMLVFIGGCIMNNLLLPCSLQRRHYNFRYVKELVSNRRANSDDPQQRFEATQTAWQQAVREEDIDGDDEVTEYVTHSGEVFTDIAKFAKRCQELGLAEETIAEDISRRFRSKLLNIMADVSSIPGGGGPVQPDLYIGGRTPKHSMIDGVLAAAWPDYRHLANPHAKLKFTFDHSVPGAVVNEWLVLPVQLKAALMVVIFSTLLVVTSMQNLAMVVWDCYVFLSGRSAFDPSSKCADRDNHDRYLEFNALLSLLFGDDYSPAESYDAAKALYYSLSVGAWTTAVVVALCAINVPLGFRRVQFELREQKVQAWNCDQDEFVPYFTTYFLPAYLSYVIIGSSLLCVIVAAAVLTVTWYWLFQKFWIDFLIPFVIAFAVNFAWNNKVFRDIIFKTYVTHKGFVVHPHAFQAMELPISGFNVILTMYAGLTRIFISLIVSIVTMLRIDCAVMPKGLENLDMGFTGLTALIFLYEKHKGPIVTEFVDYLCNPAPLHGVKNFRRDLENGRIPTTPENKRKLERAEYALERRRCRQTLDSSYYDDDYDIDDAEALRPFYVARNRWHFALMMMQNPSVMRYRHFRLPRMAVVEDDDIIDIDEDGLDGLDGNMDHLEDKENPLVIELEEKNSNSPDRVQAGGTITGQGGGQVDAEAQAPHVQVI